MMEVILTFKGLIRLGLILLIALFSGCDDLDNLAEPTITDTTAPWVFPGAQGFTASTTVPSGWKVYSTYVRFTRHSWPGPSAAHEAEATETSEGSENFRTGQVPLPGLRRGDAVFYQWFLEYKLKAGGNDIVVVKTDQQRLVTGCTPAQIRAVLVNAATVLRTRFATPIPHLIAPQPGYVLQPHFNVSLSGAGVGFAALQAGLSLGVTNLSSPDIVLYRPRPPNQGETAAQHFNAVIDPLFPDPPYTLIGAAYGQIYDPNNRPSVGCIPSDRWIVHEAGYHLANGNMTLTPPDDNGVRGSANISVPPPGIPLGVWHPRFWDIHLWLPENGDAAAVMALNKPGGVVGIPLTPGTFFVPRTFD